MMWPSEIVRNPGVGIESKGVSLQNASNRLFGWIHVDESLEQARLLPSWQWRRGSESVLKGVWCST